MTSLGTETVGSLDIFGEHMTEKPSKDNLIQLMELIHFLTY